MSLDLFLARHGESVWHAENRYAGSSDIALTPQGRRQAAALAGWAAGARLDAVWTSTLLRATETAAPAATAAACGLVTDVRLRELDFGVAEGRTQTELAETRPEDLAAFLADPVAGRFPAGEDPEAAVHRYQEALAALVAAHPGGRALVVGHSTALRLVLCSWLEVPLARYRSLFPRLVNCALTHVRLDGERTALLALNVPPRPQSGDRP